jgi:hypothetical protein
MTTRRTDDYIIEGATIIGAAVALTIIGLIIFGMILLAVGVYPPPGG